MKKFSIVTVISVIAIMLVFSGDCSAKSGANQGEDEVQVIKKDVEELNQKIHSFTLFSPEDSQKLVKVRNKLNAMANEKLSDPEYAQLFYNTAFILKEREYKQDAIQYFTVVTKNFPETVYAQRAKSELKNLGVTFEQEEEDSDY